MYHTSERLHSLPTWWMLSEHRFFWQDRWLLAGGILCFHLQGGMSLGSGVWTPISSHSSLLVVGVELVKMTISRFRVQAYCGERRCFSMKHRSQPQRMYSWLQFSQKEPLW